jgi:hypothetical protein
MSNNDIRISIKIRIRSAWAAIQSKVEDPCVYWYSRFALVSGFPWGWEAFPDSFKSMLFYIKSAIIFKWFL